ncbi:MAG: cupin domain-containing protein [bacterium]|nr:cupin domain-containing protein [bacterium]
MTQSFVEDLVKLYEMKPHPEGGFFKETYRSSGVIPKNGLPEKFKGDRSYSTAIYYLLSEGGKSKLHRLVTDEMFHFYLGDPLTVVEIRPDGKVLKTIVGPDVIAGQKVQHVIPAGHWFGAFVNPGSRYSFIGCTVAPGFDFEIFEMGNKEELLKQFPQAKKEINLLMP